MAWQSWVPSFTPYGNSNTKRVFMQLLFPSNLDFLLILISNLVIQVTQKKYCI